MYCTPSDPAIVISNLFRISISIFGIFSEILFPTDCDIALVRCISDQIRVFCGG